MHTHNNTIKSMCCTSTHAAAVLSEKGQGDILRAAVDYIVTSEEWYSNMTTTLE